MVFPFIIGLNVISVHLCRNHLCVAHSIAYFEAPARNSNPREYKLSCRERYREYICACVV